MTIFDRNSIKRVITNLLLLYYIANFYNGLQDSEMRTW